MERAYIYGDSLLKATVPDEEMHYHFHLPEVMAQYPSDRLEVVNRAKMGATVTKGLSLVAHDAARGIDARWALVAYGGNDSDFDWPAIADAPDQEHLPRTALPEFVEKLRCAARMLRDAGVQPVLMTLPPIDSARYFDFISRRSDGQRILTWLGDVGRIYLPPSGDVFRRRGSPGYGRGSAAHRRPAAVPAAARPAPAHRSRRHPSDHARLPPSFRHAGRLGAGTTALTGEKEQKLWFIL